MPKSSSIAEAAFSAAEAVSNQPMLFDAAVIPLDLELGRAAARLEHTGAIATRDEARVMAIAACKLAGLSDKETAGKIGCSRNTVAAVMEQLERRGRIPGLQERLAHALGRVAESSALELHRLIDNGEWDMETAGAVRSLGVAMGIATEKLQLVTGQATQIVEQRWGAPSADAVKEWETKLRQVFGPIIDTTDCQSNGSPRNLLNDRLQDPIATESATESAVLVTVTGGGGGCLAAAAGETTTDSLE